MTAPKSSNRGVRRGGAGGAKRRLSSDEAADLELFFSGKQASAWVLLLPEYEGCGAEVAAHWNRWKSDHPDAEMPDGLVGLLETSER